MAYVPNNNFLEEEDESNSGGSTLTGSSPSTTAPVVLSPNSDNQLSGSGGNTTTKGQAKGGISGSGFVNIDAYLNSNKEQAANLGDKVVGAVDLKGAAANQAIVNQNQAFTSQVDNNTNKLDQSIVDSAIANPTETVGNQDQLNSFVKMRDGQYSGPNSFTEADGYADTQKAVKQGIEAAENTNTAEGRKTLLTDVAANKNQYTAGAASLDNLFLQADPTAQNKLKQASTNYSDLGEKLNQSVASGGALVDGAKQTSEITRQSILNALTGNTGAINTFKGDLNTRLEQERQTATEAANALQQALANKSQLNETQLKSLGITQDQYLNLLELNRLASEYKQPNQVANNFTDYYTQQNANAQLDYNNIASQDDYARLAALSQLAGVDQTYLDESRVGTANTNLSQFNFGDAANRAKGNISENVGRIRQFATQSGAQLADYLAKNPGAVNEKAYGSNMTLGELLKQYDRTVAALNYFGI